LVDGQVKTIADLRGETPSGKFVIGRNTRARIRFGEFTLLLSWGPVPKRDKVGPLGSVDINPYIYIALSAIVHITFLTILSLMPEESLRSRKDPAAKRAKLIEMMKVAQEEEKKEEEE